MGRREVLLLWHSSSSYESCIVISIAQCKRATRYCLLQSLAGCVNCLVPHSPTAADTVSHTASALTKKLASCLNIKYPETGAFGCSLIVH